MDKLWQELRKLREQGDARWDVTLKALERTEQKMTEAMHEGFREQRDILERQHRETNERLDKAEELIYRALVDLDARVKRLEKKGA